MRKWRITEKKGTQFTFLFFEKARKMNWKALRIQKEEKCKEKKYKNDDHKEEEETHISLLYWTNGSTNFKNYFTTLCLHTVLIVIEYLGLGLCPQFLVFLVYRRTEGWTDRQLIVAGLPTSSWLRINLYKSCVMLYGLISAS